MGDPLSIGDRVRVTAERPVHGYQPGSRGTVRLVSTADKIADLLCGEYVDATAADPSLVGHRLAQLRQPQHITAEQQAEAIGIDRERLTTLYSCRLPRDQAELELIPARIGWAVGKLAGLLGVHNTRDAGS
jgi:hypothetical protein